MIGQTLSHYKVLEEISRGGMGIVYRALDLTLSRDVAFKVLPPELVADPERRRRFIQEAQAAAALEHPHIAVIHEVGEAEGVTFIAMELIRGEKLRDAMTRERLPPGRSLELATEVAEGLAWAHDKGIVHRDLKPANIMLSESGHAKIIDFGLAKLVEPLRGASGDSSDIETRLQKGTDPGIIMGTVSYMSPEQARGGKVDYRSDIFAFGIVLYEMLTGQAPFQGPSGLDTLHAILKAPAPRLPALGAEVSVEAASDLERVIHKCLAKDAGERYQTLKDVVVDLRAARRRLESGSLAPLASGPRPKSRLWAFAAGGALLVAGATTLLLWRPSRDQAPAAGSKPSVAVLYFENNTGDPSLDWMRTALTDMLVTDLSQSPQIEVLGTDRLYQILEEMNRLDERITSFNVVQELAQKASVQTVLLGSFVKSGQNIRISIRLQDAGTGKILTSEKVEGLGDSNIFPLVDDLTRRIKSKFEVPPSAEAELDRDLKDVSTSSPEAYRYYAEGTNLRERGRQEETIPLFEKAVELDPGFALALAKLSIVHWNLGHDRQAEDYAKRAFEHRERLTGRERSYVEANYESQREEGFARAIETLEKALERYPDHANARNLLSVLYGQFERNDEAIGHLEELRRRATTLSTVYGNLAGQYSARGELDKGREVLYGFLRRNPDSAVGHTALGFHLFRSGELDEAVSEFRKAESLGSNAFQLQIGRWDVAIAREEWDEATVATQKLKASSDPFRKWLGSSLSASTQLYGGRFREAILSLEEAARAFPEPSLRIAEVHGLAALVLLQGDKPAAALAEAQKAQGEGKGDLGEWQGLFATALAQARLGRSAEADKTAETLKRRTESLPTEREKRRYHHLAGELALARGDTTRAIEELKQAESMLPARGFPGPLEAQHVPVWFSLASGYLAAGDEGKSAGWFRRIVESTTEHVEWPIPYVRSFYFLGKIHERRREMDKAHEYYRRFVEFWKNGDIDRERVEEAKKKI